MLESRLNPTIIYSWGVKWFCASNFFYSFLKMSDVVWYQLYGENGKPYKNSTPSKATVAQSANIADFRKAVCAKHKDGFLKGLSAGQLRVYMRVVNPDDQGVSSASPLENIDLINQKLLHLGEPVNELG